MAEKVGDIYVDLSVRMEDTKKATSALARAFGKLAKTSLSLRPRIDQRALSDIGKSGKRLTDQLTKQFDQVAKIQAFQKLARNANAALQSTEKEMQRLDKVMQDSYKSTRIGAKYWRDYQNAANPAKAAAALEAFNKKMAASSAQAVVAARNQRSALDSVKAAQEGLATAAGRQGRILAAYTTGFEKRLLRLPPVIQNVARSLNSGLGSAFDSIARQAERSSSRASSALSRIGSSGEKAFGVLRFLSYQVISSIERMVGSFVRAGAESAAAIGYTQAALEQIQVNIIKANKGYDKLSKAQQKALDPKIYKQAEKAAGRLTDQFIKFSQETPYALDQIQEIGQQLAIAQSGLKESTKGTFDLTKVLRSLGDIASATGKGVEGMRTAAYVLQQIGQSGEIMGDDLRQLHNAIPNWRNIIAQQMGKPVSEITNKVAKSTEGINALFKGLSKGEIGNFSGVLAAQNKTVAGQFQRMVETVHNGVGRIINGLAPVLQPAFHVAGNLFAGLAADAEKYLENPKTQAAMANFTKNIKEGFAQIQAAGKSSGAFDALGKAAQQIVPMLSKGFKNAKSLVSNFFEGFSAGGGAEQFSKLVDNIKKAFETLWPVVQQVSDRVMNTLRPAFKEVGGEIATTLLPALNKLVPILVPIAKFILNMFGSALVGAIKGAVQLIKGVINVIAGVINLVDALIHGKWGQAWAALKQIVGGALNAIIGLIKVWLNVGVLSLIKGGFLKLLPSILRGGMALFKGIFSGGLKAIIGIAKALWQAVVTLFKSGVNGYTKAIQAGASKAVAIFKGLLSLIPGALRALGGLLANLARVALQTMGNAIKGAAHLVLNAVKAMIMRIPTFVIGVVTGMTSIGRDIVSGIASGISGAIDLVMNAVKSLADKIPKWAKKILGIGSPSKVMAKEVGKWIPAGIAVGIDSNFKTVAKAMTNLAIKVGKAGEKGASHIVKKFGAKLKGLASSMDAVNGLIDAARTRLKDLSDIRQTYVDLFTGFEDLSSAGMRNDAEGNSFFNFDTALADLKAARAQVNALAQQSSKVLSLGVSKETLDAILGLGPEKAAQWFSGIISGGKAIASQVNDYFTTFANAGGTIGDQVTKAFEGSTVAAATKFVETLQAKQAVLQKQFTSLAHSFAAALIAELRSTKGGINVGYGPKKKPKKPPKKAIGSMSLRAPAIAGEKGIELLAQPGTRVYNNRQTEDILGHNEPVMLSEESIALLAQAILAGQVRASTAVTQGAFTTLAVRTS